MLSLIFPYIYILHRKRKRHALTAIASNYVILRCMTASVLGVRLYLFLVLSYTVQAQCPSGFSAQSDAIGGIFATENTGGGDRIRCFSNTPTTYKQVWEVIQYMPNCGVSNWFNICNDRASRCANAGFSTASLNGYYYCKACDAGTYRSGATLCYDCGRNVYRELATANTCVQCAEGRMSRPGSTQATDCRESDCTSCGIGTYTAVTGRSFCDMCPAGTFKQNIKEKVCTSCPAGRYSCPCVHANAIAYHARENNKCFL
jgi:hypothetical protein